jgi:hypothetical protein
MDALDIITAENFTELIVIPLSSYPFEAMLLRSLNYAIVPFLINLRGGEVKFKSSPTRLAS